MQNTFKIRIVVIPDKDHAGYKYAHAAIESLKDKATSLAVILLPGDTVKDVSDWLEQGATRNCWPQWSRTAMSKAICGKRR